MSRSGTLSQLCWLVHKDLVVESRTLQAWPAMLLLGITVAVVFSLQLDVPVDQRPAATGTMLWLATLFAGLVAIERSGTAEQQAGCWDALSTYPLPAWTIYAAKLVVNVIALLVLQCFLVPLFAALADVALLSHPGAMAVVVLLGCVGLASVGTLVATLTNGLHQRGAILSVLAIPLLLPLVLSAAEATRLLAEGSFDGEWWRWVQLLGSFAIIFTTLGVTLFGFLMEE